MDTTPFDLMRSPKPTARERRGWARQATAGGAVATLRDEDGRVAMAHVTLLDASVRGLGLRSAEPLAEGSDVKLYFNGQILPGRSGVVVRCSPDADREGQWRIGVACDVRVAA